MIVQIITSMMLDLSMSYCTYGAGMYMTGFV